MNNFEKQALRKITSRKTKSELIASGNLAKLRENKKFFDLESQHIALSIKAAKEAPESEFKATLLSELQKIDNDMEALLNELGFTKNDIKTKVYCPVCNDSGYINGERCRCLIDEINTVSKEATKTSLTDISSFKKIDVKSLPKANAPTLSAAYKILDKVVINYPNIKTRILTITGPVGCGKTFAVSVASNAFAKNGTSTLIISSSDIFSIFKTYHFAFDMDEKEDIFEEILNCDVLIIDDLGSEGSVPDFLIPYLTYIIDKRSNLLTIITTNYNMEDIADHYGKRLQSRLCNVQNTITIALEGDDLRLHRNK
ncbi:MAG TPA: ATP-binding protein [Clostridia bacterium]|jgi:DNA replication protein DnaC|nr:ATP-binding protein [Clostridia bacterium]